MKNKTSLVAFCLVVIVFSLIAGMFYSNLKKEPEKIAIEPDQLKIQTGIKDTQSNPANAGKDKTADVDFGPYMADLQRRIKRAWFPPKGNESKRVVVVFKVHSNGRMSNLRLDKSSDVKIADQAALKAVENAAPFRPLPAGSPPDVDIQFTFDYNVFKSGQRAHSAGK